MSDDVKPTFWVVSNGGLSEVTEHVCALDERARKAEARIKDLEDEREATYLLMQRVSGSLHLLRGGSSFAQGHVDNLEAVDGWLETAHAWAWPEEAPEASTTGGGTDDGACPGCGASSGHLSQCGVAVHEAAKTR